MRSRQNFFTQMKNQTQKSLITIDHYTSAAESVKQSQAEGRELLDTTGKRSLFNFKRQINREQQTHRLESLSNENNQLKMVLQS